MNDERVEKIENMLSQLIRMVGSIQSNLQEMKIEQQEMKIGQQEMKIEQQEMKAGQQEMKLVQQDIQSKLQDFETKGEERHKEILDRFKFLENDQDFIWEKTARNEREIAHIKGQLSSPQ